MLPSNSCSPNRKFVVHEENKQAKNKQNKTKTTNLMKFPNVEKDFPF